MRLLQTRTGAFVATGLRMLALVAAVAALCASLAAAGCSDDKDATKLSTAGESCAEAADCAPGLACVKLVCTATGAGLTDVGGGGSADAGSDAAADTVTGGCAKTCVYYKQPDQCAALGGVAAPGSCAAGTGKKQLCCDLDKAPACGAPYKCLGGKDPPCAAQGGTAVVAWCGRSDQSCCDLTAPKACAAPAECIKGSIKDCYTKGGSSAAGACGAADQTCCAMKPCEAPLSCMDSAACHAASGQEVGYACKYPGVCCDKGADADAGSGPDAAGEADAG